jgi:hypothetical protein
MVGSDKAPTRATDIRNRKGEIMTVYVAPEPPDSINGQPLTDVAKAEWLDGCWWGVHVAHGGTAGEVLGVTASAFKVAGFNFGVSVFDGEYKDEENEIYYGDDIEWEN